MAFQWKFWQDSPSIATLLDAQDIIDLEKRVTNFSTPPNQMGFIATSTPSGDFAWRTPAQVGIPTVGTDGSVGGPGGTGLTTPVIQIDSGIGPKIDHVSALNDLYFLYYSASAKMFKGTPIGGFISGSTPGAVTSVFTRTGAVLAQSGDYSVGQVTGAAPLNSPALTGAPTAPTPSLGDNSTKIATTAYVQLSATPGGGGMVNPMATPGDMIVGGPVVSGVATPGRLGIGSDWQSLRSLSGMPVWIGPERVPLLPSGDTTGTTDDTNFAAACARLDGTSGKPAGGEIVLVSNYNKPFYTKNSAGTYTATGWSPPGQILASGHGGAVCLQGAGIAVLMPVGAAKTGIYYHGQSVTGENDYYKGGYVRDVLIDGSLSTGASVGFDVGDIIGMHIRGGVRNFSGSGAIGAQFMNRTFFTEKGTFEISTFNCDTAALVDHSAGGVASHEYNIYDLTVHATGKDGSGNSLNQTGVVLQDPLGRCRLYIRGNMISTTATSGNPAGNAALLSILGAAGGSMFRCHMIVGAEVNSYSGVGSVKPYSVYQDGAGGTMTNCSGHVNISDGFTQWSANGDEHSFNGPVTLSQQPNWPASQSFSSILQPGDTNKSPQGGTTSPAKWTNLGVPANFRVSGSAVTDCQIDGQSLGGSPPWFGVCAPGSTITIPFSGSTLSNVNLSIMRAIGGG